MVVGQVAVSWRTTKLSKGERDSEGRYYFIQVSPMAQMVKNLPAMQETQVQSLD